MRRIEKFTPRPSCSNSIPALRQCVDVACNFMGKFKIKIVSQGNSIIAILLFLLIFFPLMLLRNKYLPVPLGTAYAILIGIPSLLLFYFLFQKIATAKTEWLITDDLVTINWLTQFPFSKQPSIIVKWSDIETFKDSGDPMYHTFTIKMLQGTEYKFYHGNPILSGGKFDDEYSTMVDFFSKSYNAKKLQAT